MNKNNNKNYWSFRQAAKMVNQNLIKYIQTEEAQGYSEQQLKDFLIKQGYNQNEVIEAINFVNSQKNTSTNKSTINNNTQNLNCKIKKRNVGTVLILSLVTFGIYYMMWLVSTTKELKSCTNSAPNPKLLWLLLVPGVNVIISFIYVINYCKAINELTGYNHAILILLWVLVSPVAIVIAQNELNKKATN